MIVDGRRVFGCSLEQWAEGRAPGSRRGLLPKLAREHGFVVPPLTRVAQGEVVVARIDYGRWIADCPCGGAEMIWLEGPWQIWCATCGNVDIGGQWRAVAVPENHAEISAELASKPWREQQWRPEV